MAAELRRCDGNRMKTMKCYRSKDSANDNAIKLRPKFVCRSPDLAISALDRGSERMEEGDGDD